MYIDNNAIKEHILNDYTLRVNYSLLYVKYVKQENKREQQKQEEYAKSNINKKEVKS